MKIERDAVEILSGVRHGRTLGSPISLVIRNRAGERPVTDLSQMPVENVVPLKISKKKRKKLEAAAPIEQGASLKRVGANQLLLEIAEGPRDPASKVPMLSGPACRFVVAVSPPGCQISSFTGRSVSADTGREFERYADGQCDLVRGLPAGP